MSKLRYKETSSHTLNIILSYSMMHKCFLPHEIMVYTYRLVMEGVVEDYWRDWVFYWRSPYSERIDRDLYNLYLRGYLKKTCVENICGFYTLTDKSLSLLKQTTL